MWTSVACEVALTCFLCWHEHRLPFLKGTVGQRWGLLAVLGDLQGPSEGKTIPAHAPWGRLMVGGAGEQQG